MNLSSDQTRAISTILDWYNSAIRDQFITLGGYAGTGKTTVVSKLRERFPVSLRIAYCAYTGKATSVLRNKLLNTKSLYKDDNISTIHSLIYEPIMKDEEIIGWSKKPNIDYDLIIVDESSMVSKDIFEDLLSYGIPIICIGDHGQLPPVSADSFNLMRDPLIKLETIHRYDSSEESPLLKVSMLARKEGNIPFGYYGKCVLKVHKDNKNVPYFIKMMDNFEDSFCIVGENKTRIKLNKYFRKILKRPEEYPTTEDRVICLRNNTNSSDIPIYNGMIGTITEKRNRDKCYQVTCRFDGENDLYYGFINRENFNYLNNGGSSLPSDFVYESEIVKWKKQKTVGDYYSVNNNIIRKNKKVYLDNFDYGYCITCHKSQGSEMKNVMVIEERNYYMDDDMWSRWLYTAVTRSRENLIIVSKT